MIVCLCHSVSDKKLRQLVLEEGISDMKGIRRCTALGSQCGKCVRHAKDILNETVASQYKQVS
ncbi:(2Fe-2S)-binding protein [Vibrio rhizosphaerae]|uniref:Bacterioferritin-associated ferredoxin n=1 Tax=Vibrio rhizosphaerae TaxID=398736 RepID=A0ABU4INX9_9VIBR|nr:(2Fe-2S)-binding protein [Vibrio rhizosphaerae]MDW6091110.1 (2Fe-2S)-binding protein [Vibrio rhizosphaerae]